MPISFSDFLATVPEEQRDFVSSLHVRLTENGCTIRIKEAKSGYAVSYLWENRTMMNWVFRKSGILVRIYGDHSDQYESVIAALPVDMQKKMTGSRDCKRLKDPSACSNTCVMGFVYDLDGTIHQKCRNDGMLFPLFDKTSLHIQSLLDAELAVRQKTS